MSELFIGRMSISVDENDDRYEKKYYDAGYSKEKNPREKDWLNGLKEGDYVLLSVSFTEKNNKGKIGYSKDHDNKIVLWRVKEIKETETDFEEVKDNIKIKLHKLAALKILKITKVTANLAMKSSNSTAFWKLDLIRTLDQNLLKKLSEDKFYLDENNYRKIILFDDRNYIDINSEDIQLYKENNQIHIYRASFIDNNIISHFNDQTKYLDIKNIERKPQKDRFLEKIKKGDLSDITIPQLYDSMFTEYNRQGIVESSDDELPDKEKEKKQMPEVNKTQPLNQILYGPPGTGKTYNTINKALEIIDGIVPDSRTKIKERFEELKKAGQIEFVTFHQSYGYEEFVEGIKAIPPKEKGNENGSEMIYKVVNGIFQKLSNKAKENYENSKKTSIQIIKEKSLKQRIEQFLNDAFEAQDEFTKTKGGKFKIKDLSETAISIFTEDSNYSENVIELDIDELTKILSCEIDIKTSRQLAKDVFGINNQRQKDTYYFSMLKKFKEIKFDNIEEVEKEEVLKNHILIIDEINRGNISKIFGELITLIEPSKRIGADEEIKVKLPYSNDDFGVPSNLYIIGTMNTADRSIALMDTALRRRFDFTEMMPCAELIDFEVDGINIKYMLEKINKRVEYLYDRDHTIGHAYFMSLKDEKITDKKAELDNIFRNKIIPLLQEYFYDDWEKILMVLGDGFINRTGTSSDIFDEQFKDSDHIEDDKKFVYSIKDTFDFSKFK